MTHLILPKTIVVITRQTLFLVLLFNIDHFKPYKDHTEYFLSMQYIYRKKYRSKSKGFTMLEILMTMIIIVTLAMSVGIKWPTSTNVIGQLKSLTSDIRFMQRLAILGVGNGFRVNFPNTTQYSLSRANGTPYLHPATQSALVTLPSGMVFSNITNLPNNLIAFDNRGTPFVDSALSIPLTVDATISITQSGVTKSLIITPETGLVR